MPPTPTKGEAEPIVLPKSGVYFRKDLVLYALTQPNFDQCGNECYLVHYINGQQLRLTDPGTIAEMKKVLGYL